MIVEPRPRPHVAKPPRPKRQHYVPRFYLEHFADSDGYVWTYDSTDGSSRKARAEQTAVETNFYSVRDASGDHFDEVEKWLAEIEDRAAPIYPRVLRGERLVGEEREVFALFVASLHTRSPAMINATARGYGQMIEKTGDMLFGNRDRFNEHMDRSDKEAGRITPAEERKKLFDFYNDKSAYRIKVDKKIGLLTIDIALAIAGIIHDMSWIVVEPENQHIITGDNPVVRITPREFWHPFYGDGGFAHEKAFVTLPLSPNRLLEAYRGKSFQPGVYRADKQRGRLYNRQRAGFAERYLYSSRQDAGISALAVKHHGPGMKMSISPGTPGAEIVLARKL